MKRARLTPQERFRDYLYGLDISQRAAARILYVSPNTISRWATGRRPVPPLILDYLALYEARCRAVFEASQRQ